MFKKKTSLPARPPVPNKEEILDDLANATSDDVVFIDEETATFVTEAADPLISTSIDKMEGYEALNLADYKYSHQAYLKVASFVEKYNNLQKYFEELLKKSENLKILEHDFKTDMIQAEEEYRKRAESPNGN